ncbi:hypothetical protein QQP08_026911 [Theobroma cacao]|nr:hypothetical protein QQP08_026911 [Theobroma cacao]
MGEQAFFDRMMGHLRSTCKEFLLTLSICDNSRYYTGYPKDLGPSRVIHFTSEREFVQLLHQGRPVVVAFTIRGNYTMHLDRVLEEAAAEFYPNVKFMRVECPKYPGFCITRQKKEYPFIEIFHSPEQAADQGRVADKSITRYSVKVLPVSFALMDLENSSSAMGYRREIQSKDSWIQHLPLNSPLSPPVPDA